MIPQDRPLSNCIILFSKFCEQSSAATCSKNKMKYREREKIGELFD